MNAKTLFIFHIFHYEFNLCWHVCIHVVYEIYSKIISFASVFAFNVDLYMLYGSAGHGRCKLQNPYATMN
jgi:hypothetical protein